MGMDDAVETITQVLFRYRPYANFLRVSLYHSRERAAPHGCSRRESEARQLYSREQRSRHPTTQNFRIILRSSCIVKKRPPFPVELDVPISLLHTEFRSSLTDSASILAAGHRSKKVCVRHASLMNIARVLSHGNDTIVFDAMSSSVS